MNSELQAALQLLTWLILDPRTGTLIGLVLIAAWSDCKTRRIPNWIVFAGALVGLFYNALVPSLPEIGLLGALEGMALGLALLLPFYLLRAMGAGDVKLMAMVGAFVGFPTIIYTVLATFIAGGALSLAYAVWKGALRRMFLNIVILLQGAMLSMVGGGAPTLAADSSLSVGKVPYGVAIATGTIGYLILKQLGFVW